jgi:hypothetical protein
MKALPVKIIVLLLLCGLTVFPILAQDAETIYVITAPQQANARECPHLTCPIVLVFPKGEEVSVSALVPGDTITGSSSNLWLEVPTESGIVYVHNSLAEPTTNSVAATSEVPFTSTPMNVPATPTRVPTETPAPTEESAPAEATHPGWSVFNGGGYTLETPGSWMSAAELFSDQDLVNEMAKAYGLDAKTLADQLQEGLDSGLFDVYMLDLLTGISLDIRHEDRRGLPVTLSLLRRILIEQAKSAGATVIKDEIIELPIGSAVRLHFLRVLSMGTFRAESHIFTYAVVEPENIYYLEITIPSVLYDSDSEATADAIASTFQIGEYAPITGPKA